MAPEPQVMLLACRLYLWTTSVTGGLLLVLIELQAARGRLCKASTPRPTAPFTVKGVAREPAGLDGRGTMLNGEAGQPDQTPSDLSREARPDHMLPLPGDRRIAGCEGSPNAPTGFAPTDSG